eukprot:3006747-Rhodomonas_salina.1
MMSSQQLLAVCREVLQQVSQSSLSSSRLLRVSPVTIEDDAGAGTGDDTLLACGPSPIEWFSIHSNAADARRPGGTALSQFRQTASTWTKGNRAVILNPSSSGVHGLISI